MPKHFLNFDLPESLAKQQNMAVRFADLVNGALSATTHGCGTVHLPRVGGSQIDTDDGADLLLGVGLLFGQRSTDDGHHGQNEV